MLCDKVVKKKLHQRLSKVRSICWWCNKAEIEVDKIIGYRDHRRNRPRTYRGFFVCPRCKMLGMTWQEYTSLEIMRGIREVKII